MVIVAVSHLLWLELIVYYHWPRYEKWTDMKWFSHDFPQSSYVNRSPLKLFSISPNVLARHLSTQFCFTRGRKNGGKIKLWKSLLKNGIVFWPNGKDWDHVMTCRIAEFEYILTCIIEWCPWIVCGRWKGCGRSFATRREFTMYLLDTQELNADLS